jgi:hypothetical protein
MPVEKDKRSGAHGGERAVEPAKWFSPRCNESDLRVINLGRADPCSTIKRVLTGLPGKIFIRVADPNEGHIRTVNS